MLEELGHLVSQKQAAFDKWDCAIVMDADRNHLSRRSVNLRVVFSFLHDSLDLEIV
jgi:hypothetical protein